MSRAQGLARTEIVAPVEAGKHGGLCSTCVHDAICTFRRDAGHPVIQCEEFESAAPVEAEVNSRPVLVWVQAASTPDGAEELDPSRAQGLCRTCAHRSTCTFPAGEAGVWHCEEYE